MVNKRVSASRANGPKKSAKPPKRGVAGAEVCGVPAPAGRATADPKRVAILNAAGDVLVAKGFAAMTTLDVARAAGISKRDLYAQFASKTALIEAMVAQGVTEMVAPVVLTEAETREAFFERLAEFGAKFVGDMLTPNRVALYRLAIAEATTSPDVGSILLERGTQETVRVVEAFFERAQARGLVAFPSVQAAMGLYFSALMADRMVTHLLAPGRTITPEEVKRQTRFALMAVEAFDGFEPQAAMRPEIKA